jgi:hypothetical protein
MKTRIISSRRPDGYAVLLLVLVLCACSILIMVGDMMRTSTESKLNMRSNQLAVLSNAAEGATEKVYSQMAHDFSAYGPGIVSNNLPTYATMIPNSNDSTYFNNFVFSDGQGNLSKTYVAFLTNYTGPLPTQYTNQYATTSPIYRIISNASMPNSLAPDLVGTAQEDMMMAQLPITTYAIFYNGDLEFSDCATMTVGGRVHSNGNICDGSASTLTFNGAVTCSGVIWSPERGLITYSPVNENVTFNSTKATNVTAVQISIPMTNTHSIIDFPAPGENAMSNLGQNREYNKAQVLILVSNSPTWSNIPQVTLQLQTALNGNNPGVQSQNGTATILTVTNASGDWLTTNPVVSLRMAFLTLTNTFTDQRENQANMLVTQIDVGAYAAWLATNSAIATIFGAGSGNYPTILYVADKRNIGTTKLAVVRLSDAQKLPLNTANGLNLGFSVATPNPLYIWGMYNTTLDGVHFAYTVGSTTNGYSVPAALFSDALTILSASWNDSKSGGSYSSRNTVAANMTINAAIVTGNMPSTGTTATTFSGGVHNLTRMLENWSSVTLTYNTSIVCLFTSQMATNQFQMPGNYYNPPTRNWGFDLTYYDPDKQPPGVPCALVPIRYNWMAPPPNSTL